MADLTRNSTRNFSDKQVDLDVLKHIISEAQKAPSWENAQPYQVYLATGETAKRLRKSHEKLVSSGEKSWTEVVPPQEWDQKAQANINNWQASAGASPKNTEFGEMNDVLFNAPAILYITIKKDASSYVAYDAGAFGYGVILAAQKQGVGSIPAFGFARYPAEVHNEFDIPDDQAIFMGIGLGYAADDSINDFKFERNELDQFLTIKD